MAGVNRHVKVMIDGPVFYPCNAMLVRVLPIIVCLSVRLSVFLSNAGIVLKRLNVGLRKQCHVIAQGL